MEHHGTPRNTRGNARTLINTSKKAKNTAGVPLFQKECVPLKKAPTIVDYLNDFENWIIRYNFDSTSIYNDPKRVEEFLIWLKVNHPFFFENALLEVGSQTIHSFFEYLQNRPNLKNGGALSLATLRNYQKSLRRFTRHLEQQEKGRIDVSITLKKGTAKIPSYFTPAEIQALYETTKDNAIGQRDRVLLGIYYGCGLRKSEGGVLKLSDIMSDKSLLYVRHGKGGKSRYVPMVGRIKKDLYTYLNDGRKHLLKSKSSPYLFINREGNRMRKGSLYCRFRVMQKDVITQPKGLHALRHSIATHLLWQGMPLHFIARFLGHTSIESTQIYTHIMPTADKYQK